MNIIIILFFILLSNDLYGVNSKLAHLNLTEVVVVNSKSKSIVWYDVPACKEIKFIQIEFKSNLIGSQSFSIKSESDKSEFILKNEYNQSIVTANRIICSKSRLLQCNKTETLILEIATEFPNMLSVNVTAFLIEDFTIKIGEQRSVMIADNSPKYWLLKFNNTNVDMEIIIKSDDDQCMCAFIEQAECSVNILNPDLETVRKKTITKTGSIQIKNFGQFKNSLFIVFILIENRFCKKNLKARSSSIILRQKKMNITFVDINTSYKMPVSVLVILFILFGMFYILFYCLSFMFIYPKVKGQTNSSANQNERIKKCSKIFTFCCGTYRPNCKCPDQKDIGVRIRKETKWSIFFTWCCNKYSLNFTYIFAISVFYGLPAIQLLWHFLNIMEKHGNFDDCFYNDHCSKPWKIFISFNNVISNCGYIILGITFLIIVSINRCFMKKHSLETPNYGIFYALGFSLMMLGIMSASYHHCPRSNTIQFDATFMYIIGYLLNGYCAIKLLQMFGKNEVDTEEKLKHFLFFMSIVMLVIIVALIFESENKIVNICVYTIIQTLVISISYYKIFSSIVSEFSRICHCIFIGIGLILFIITPIFVHIFGLYFSFLSGILLSFLFLFVRLLVMFEKKLKANCSSSKNHNTCKHLSSTFLSLNFFLSIIFWVPAIILFIQAPTDWKKTASESRENNQGCIIGDFYDIHDLWHILSSIAMFLSFMWIFIIDGNMFIQNSNIPDKEQKRSTI